MYDFDWQHRTNNDGVLASSTIRSELCISRRNSTLRNKTAKHYFDSQFNSDSSIASIAGCVYVCLHAAKVMETRGVACACSRSANANHSNLNNFSTIYVDRKSCFITTRADDLKIIGSFRYTLAPVCDETKGNKLT